MKIVKSVSEVLSSPPQSPTAVKISDVKHGTVFLYGNYRAGPYLRTTTGFLHFSSGTHYPDTLTIFTNYKELSNAVLVTNE